MFFDVSYLVTYIDFTLIVYKTGFIIGVSKLTWIPVDINNILIMGVFFFMLHLYIITMNLIREQTICTPMRSYFKSKIAKKL